MKTQKTIFKKHDLIKCEKENYQCIIADEELAVFGKISRIENGGRTAYRNTFIVSNTKALQDGFEYQRI